MIDKIAYNEDSPSGIIWKETFGKVKAGEVAGTKRSDGYWRVGKYKEYVHRLVWQLFNGKIIGKMSIDHIDGNTSNNKIENLRLVTHKENMRNTKKNKNNKSGINGVALENIKGFEYWSAIWNEVNGTPSRKRFSVKELGNEQAFLNAVEYRKEVEDRLSHFSERHGKEIQLGEPHEIRTERSRRKESKRIYGDVSAN